MGNTDHQHIKYEDIENYMGINGSNEDELEFLEYFEECLNTCIDCQERFYTYTFLNSLTSVVPEDTVLASDSVDMIKAGTLRHDELIEDLFISILGNEKYHEINNRAGIISQDKLKTYTSVAA